MSILAIEMADEILDMIPEEIFEMRRQEAKNTQTKKNAELLALYVSKQKVFEKIKAKAMQENISDKLILHLPFVHYEYEASKIRLMIVGQENNGWKFTLDCLKDDFKKSIMIAMEHTEKYQTKAKDNNTPFWDVASAIHEFLNTQIKPKTHKKSGVVWSNLNRISFNDNLDSKKPKSSLPKSIQDIIDNDLSTLLLEEIKIIKPDIVLFLTGPNYDDRILAQLQEANIFKVGDLKQIGGFSIKELAAIEHKELPQVSMRRLYHPNYTYKSGKRKEYLSACCLHFKKLAAIAYFSILLEQTESGKEILAEIGTQNLEEVKEELRCIIRNKKQSK